MSESIESDSSDNRYNFHSIDTDVKVETTWTPFEDVADLRPWGYVGNKRAPAIADVSGSPPDPTPEIGICNPDPPRNWQRPRGAANL